MERIPTCLLPELPLPTTEIEAERMLVHSEKIRAIHAEWSQKIREYGQRGLLSRKSSLMNGVDFGVEMGYVDPSADNLSLFRFWGMTLNDICVIEEQLASYDDRTTYLALATERRLDRNMSHFSLFSVNLATGAQDLIFHRSDCAVVTDRHRVGVV